MKKHLVLLALLAPMAAYAVDGSKDEYIGGNLSLTRHSVGMGNPAFNNQTKSDSNDTGYGLRAGFYSHDNLSWELDYQNYGKNVRTYSTNGKVESALSSVGVSAVGHLPLNDKLGLYGRVGLARVESKTTSSGSIGATGFKARKTVPVIGIGLEAPLSPEIRGYVEYAQTGKVKSSTGGAEDSHSASRLSAGITYHY